MALLPVQSRSSYPEGKTGNDVPRKVCDFEFDWWAMVPSIRKYQYRPDPSMLRNFRRKVLSNCHALRLVPRPNHARARQSHERRVDHECKASYTIILHESTHDEIIAPENSLYLHIHVLIFSRRLIVVSNTGSASYLLPLHRAS